MTLVTVSSVKGAPGCTTVALLLARSLAESAHERRLHLLAECDPSGGDLAPALGLPGVPGMSSLAVAARHGLSADLLLAHAQAPAALPGLRVLLGVAGPEQGVALSWLWRDLGLVLADPSIVAVADLGRCGLDDRHRDLHQAAAANLLVTTDGVAPLLHVKAAVESAQQAGRSVGVVVAGERRRRFVQIAEATGANVLGAVRYDPAALSSVLQYRHADSRFRALKRPTSPDGLLADVSAIVKRLADGAGTIGPTPVAPPAAGPAAFALHQRVISRLRRVALLG